MLKILTTIFTLLALMAAGCGADASNSSSVQQNKANAENNGRKVIMQFAKGHAVLILNNSKVADNLYNMLPLQLSFKDFNRTEKIAYPPHPVHEGLRPDFVFAIIFVFFIVIIPCLLIYFIWAGLKKVWSCWKSRSRILR